MLFVLDQALKKGVISQQLSLGGAYVGIGSHYNAGAAFSLAIPSAWALLLASAFFIVVSILLFSLRHTPNLKYPLIIMAFAASSNILDRFLRGAVIDYFYLGNVWLNMADVGLALAALSILRNLVASSQ